MKKWLTLFLAFLLLVSNSGIVFNVHYCGNKIASISLKTNKKAIAIEENCCGIAEEQSNCCNDKSFSLQENSDKFQENTIAIDFKFANSIAMNDLFATYQITNFKNVVPASKYKLIPIKIAIFKRNCQLVFYA